MDISGAGHWEDVYGSKEDVETSWFEPVATDSLAMLDRLGVVPSIDIVAAAGRCDSS